MHWSLPGSYYNYCLWSLSVITSRRYEGSDKWYLRICSLRSSVGGVWAWHYCYKKRKFWDNNKAGDNCITNTAWSVPLAVPRVKIPMIHTICCCILITSGNVKLHQVDMTHDMTTHYGELNTNQESVSKKSSFLIF